MRPKLGHNEFPIAYQYKHMAFEPLMLQLTMLMKESGKTHAEIERESGVTGQTFRNWVQRKTKRPNASTLRAVAKVLGYRLTYEKD
jgi:transcriptional regulator with XRE-family HTH domain